MENQKNYSVTEIGPDGEYYTGVIEGYSVTHGR